VALRSIMYDMTNTATYIPGRHQPFDLSDIFVEALPPKIEKPRKEPQLLGGQLKSFAEYVREQRRPEWALYPFRYKTAGGAAAGCNNARKIHGQGLAWECRGTSLFAKAVTP
jgi:hypothetical protein